MGMRSYMTWNEVPAAPLDPILGVNQKFQADTSAEKVNVSIGAYRTDEGKPMVLSCVKKAEALLLEQSDLNKEYLPQRGDATYVQLCQKMLFGEKSKLLASGVVATAQTLSGTGALRLGAEFMKKFAKGKTVYISNPTWGTHNSIMTQAGVPFSHYRYWNAAGRDLDLAGMLEDIEAAPEGSVIMLHAAAHNPTGVDPTAEQWGEIMTVCKAKKHVCWFDSAYQGFATGDLDIDATAMRAFADEGLPLFVSQSFAKNFGLYGERVGTFSITCDTPEAVKAVMSQLDIIIRNLYSNPPKHGANIVKTVLSDPALYQEWRDELKAMSLRIQDMRTALYDELTSLGTPGSWTHITSQIGMFSFTGLSPEQCTQMVEKHHVYMLNNGRVSMAGVTSKNVKYIAKAIDDVVRNF
ncbi:aspartate aminotransferase [Emiliania huxleyi CCMP1516]|uniref:Aspartate aminotransferase n=2 Tax=Emiliania huxleyi TaxID=2903 RepID=A0A0D3IL08_EMIH1|nr:aspartate aminotransferase [Emiliania huxleyi CCMP1516]EOD11943.1 aspartate aminotransferase [Emiliania huxleyi CCMP1516]|eukprot:XP_005764372.1 aspartate aminotransferase [Emiliania huxleyi CCMP1516]